MEGWTFGATTVLSLKSKVWDLKTSKFDLEKTIDTNFSFFANIFCSKEEMTEYWNRFSEIGEDLTIFTISQFYVFLKQIEERKYDSLRLIMLTSIIEKLNSKEDHLTFPEWISKENKKEELKKRGLSLWDEYNKIHGSSGKFRRFFKNYLSKDENIDLIRSVLSKAKLKVSPTSELLVPRFCYEDKCNVRFLSCNFDRNKDNCPLVSSPSKLRRAIKNFSDFLYSLRNSFVHQANIVLLSEVDYNGTPVLLLEYIPAKKTNLVIRLAPEQLETLLEKNFKKLLDDYITNRKGTQRKNYQY